MASRRKWLVPLLLLTLLGAAANQEYLPPVLGRKTALTSETNDLAVTASYQVTQPLLLRGRANVTASVTASVSTATCVIVIARGTLSDDGKFRPVACTQATFYASTIPLNGGYDAGSAAFDTAGYWWAMLSVRSVSAGTVDLSWSVH